MTSAEDKFETFFRTATGRKPYDYQRRLAVEEPFPELLDVPTGLGKTAAAVLAWLWRRRFHEKSEVRARTPRRLIYCLPMRVLVEQTHAESIRWLDRLGMLAGNAQWDDSTQKKGLLQYEPEPEAAELVADSWARRHGDQGLPIGVHILMGGAERTDWVLWPERDAVLIGTQDMLLSRALNRGYAAGRARWPMEFGLLNNDCLWVFDEVQLMGSGLATSLQLQAWRESLRLRAAKDCFPVPAPHPVYGPAHSLWMSATTAKHWFEKAVDWRPKVDEAWNRRERLRKDEKEHGDVGALFKNTQKQLPPREASGPELRAPATKEGKANKAEEERQTHEYLTALAEKIADNRSSDGLTLVIVNTVERASRLYELVKAEAHTTSVHLIHSRFRPHERHGWRPILSKDNTTPRIIISTQVVEAGVDFSAQVLFTELAPWASLVQRFGRCARYPGEEGIIYWMDLEGDKNARPYDANELEAARKQLTKLPDVGLGTLTTLAESLDQGRKEALLPYEPKFVPREKDLFELFDTTPDLTGADIDISRFIREGRELDVLVYWRDVETPGKADRPLREELCPVAFYRFREQVAALRKHGRFWRRHYRKGWEEIGGGNTETIYPGQVFLLQRSCGGYSEERGWTGKPDDRAVWVEKAVSAQPENEDLEESDDRSESQWLTIAQHSRNVCQLLEEAVLRDQGIARATRPYGKILSSAARWHDRGKAHSAFKAKLRTAALESEETRRRLSSEPTAKAPTNAWRGPNIPETAEDPDDKRRPGFRHELASALAALETLWAAQRDHPAFAWPEGLERPRVDEPRPSWLGASEHKTLIDELANLSAEDFDLLVYLIASHHGKVRMSLRSSPDDSKTTVPDPCPGETPQARGVRDGDIVPACNLPGPCGTPLRAPEVRLHLDPMSLGLSDRYGPSWRERTQALLERLGPFRLGYLEALLRAADWRASSEERTPRAETPMVREEEAEYQQQLASAKEFVERWRYAGPALEEQHWRELQELDDDTARRMTIDLFKLWRPSDFDDLGAGMVEQQRLLAKLREHEAKEAKKR